MIRVAKRWNDYSFIADFVGQKYDPIRLNKQK